jgi:small conductance mechanosensitive channel
VIWAADETRSFTDVARDAAPDAGMTLFVIVGAIVVWLIFARVGHRYVTRLAARSHDDGPNAAAERAKRVNTLWRVARSLFAATLVVVVVLTIMSIWGIPIGPLVAVGTVVGVALGFGAQDLVRDFIAGFLIVAEDQFAIGDVVSIGGVTGTVQEIQLRVTVLRDLEGRVHYVPNGKIEVATNYTKEFSRVVVDVSVAYKENIERVLAIIEDEMRSFAAEPEWLELMLDDPTLLGVNKLADSSVVIRLVFVTIPAERWTVKREFLKRVKNRLDAESIEIPFPHITVDRGSPVATPEGAPPEGPPAPG